MKKKLTSLILCAVLVFTTLAATSCGFNWENDAAAAVTLDYKAVLKAGKITTTKKIVKPGKDNIHDVWHDLLVLAGNAKDQRVTDEKLGIQDTVTVSVSVKDSADAAVSLDSANKEKTVNLWENLTDAQKADALYSYIHESLRAKITGTDGIKVGETVTLEKKPMEPKETSSTTGTTTTKTYSFKTDLESTKKYTITYTVTAAKMPGSEVTFADKDILSLFIISKKDGEYEKDGQYNWAYNFTSTSSTNAPSGDMKDFDPYDAIADTRIPQELYEAVFGAHLPDKNEGTGATVIATNNLVSLFDYVQVKVEAQYGEYEADGVTVKEDSWKKLTDISSAKKTQDIKFAVSGYLDNEYYDWIRDALTAKIGEAKVGESNKLTFTDAKAIKIATDGSTAELLSGDNKDKFYVDGKDGAELRPVKITYSVTNAFGGQDWTELTVGDTTYYYFVSGIKELGEVDLAALATEAIGNGSKYDNERPDKGETDRDTRVLLLSSHVDSEEGATETKTHYSSSLYGDKISFLVKTNKDGDIIAITTGGDHADESDDGEALKYTFKYFDDFGTAEVTIDTEAKAVKYAIERALDLDYERLRLRYATDEMWTKLLNAAAVEYPQSLLDAYYSEYYENMRYEFHKEKYDDEVGGYKPSSTGATVITSAEGYIFYTLKVENWDAVRAAVDKLAKEDLKPRLVINKLASELGIKISDQEIKDAYQADYEDYANLQRFYAQLGYSVTIPANVTEYIDLVCGGMESVRTGMLYDKIMHTFYDNQSDYSITIDDKGPTT